MGGSQSLSHDELKHSFFTMITSEYMGNTEYINVGIDDSLLKYSGTGSNAMLNGYSSELLGELQGQAPDYIEKVGTALAGLSAVPNAVGVGALIISMILQIAFTATKSNEERPMDMLRRIFAEEKASEVRDLLEEYLKRYKMHLRNSNLLLEDTRQLERSLSQQLTRLRNSMIVDGHMNSRALKHWANGAAFHAQLLIHMARLQKKKPQSFEIAKSAASSAIDTYKHDTSELLKKYKEYKTLNFELYTDYVSCLLPVLPTCHTYDCYFKDLTGDMQSSGWNFESQVCELSRQDYIDYIFSNHKQIIQLKSYFPDLIKNLPGLFNEEGTFQIRK